jgi:hypothetical protein
VQHDLQRRHRVLDVVGSGGIEIWVHQVRGSRGEQMTFEDVEPVSCATGTIPFFFTEADIRL